MANLRRNNTVSGLRIDTPYLKSIESAVSNDFDDLSNALLTGINASYVLRGFNINMTGAVGSSASGLQMIVGDAAFLHGSSATSGTFYIVPSTSPSEVMNATVNPRIDGAFIANTLNYVGIDFVRQVDDTTVGQAYVWEPSTNTEITKTIPLAEVLGYKIVISASPWAAGVLPIATVQTDTANNVSIVTDRRPMFFRLGTAGSNTPNPFYTYPWSEGRTENAPTSSSSLSPFLGGDKQIGNEKEWKDAIMSALKEIKGTTYWYSENSGGSIIKIRSDLANLTMTGKGNISHAKTQAGQINWSEDIFFNLIGSRLSYKLQANPSSQDILLTDNEAAYINIVRNKNIIPNLIFTQGSTAVNSVGSVSWTNNVLAGDFVKLGAGDDTTYYKIASVDTASQVTLTEAYAETSTGIGGELAQYAWGTYIAVPTPTTNRHIQIADRKDVPFNEDTFWLMLRQDNGGAVARVYFRGSGFGELEQGESREVSDNESDQLLEYIGSPSEATSTPDYTGAVAPAVQEVFTITFADGSDITSGEAFEAYSASDAQKHYFWFNVDGAGGDPLIPNAFGHAIPVSSSDPATAIATIAAPIIDAIGAFDAVDNLDGTVTVTLSQAGTSSDAANIDVGGAFAIVIDTQGSGSVNNVVVDGENLTKSIKRLDDALGQVVDGLTQEGYEETLTVVSGAPATDNEVTGPIVVNSTITIPLNSRDSDIQQSYVVGAGTLTVFLNGVRMSLGLDYNEIGTSGDDSTEIENLIQLEVDDVLVFRLEASGLSGGGSGGSMTAINLGSPADADVFKQIAVDQFQFRRLVAGSNMSITQNANQVIIAANVTVGNSSVLTFAANHTVLTTNDVLLGNANAGNITFTLPPAAATTGKIYNFKKITASNTMFIKSVSGQTLDGVDIDATPLAISTQWETLTITSDGTQYFIL
jgi:hypothetical protein